MGEESKDGALHGKMGINEYQKVRVRGTRGLVMPACRVIDVEAKKVQL
jgi:hypothetical protein